MTTGGVLFDLDGVLVDSATSHLEAYERVFREAGLRFPEIARNAVREGKTRSSVIDLALPEAPADLKRELADAKPRALEAAVANRIDCGMPGAARAVRTLAEAGVPMGVVTNSRAPQIWLQKMNIATLIPVIVTGGDVASPKPSPEGYLLGASRLNVKPKYCLAIEDSHDGWLAATNAGMRVAVVADEHPGWLDANAELVLRLDASDILRRMEQG